MEDLIHRAQAGLIRSTLSVLRPLPLERRVAALGRLTEALTRGRPDLRGRIDANLALVFPDMDESERRRIRNAAARNAGRVLATVFYAPEFARTLDDVRVTGPGLEVLREAHAEKRGGLALSGHFGRWEVARFVLKREGMESAGIYRVNNNPHYDPLFLQGILESGRPVVPKGRMGLRELVRLLRGGSIVGMLIDQRERNGPRIPLLGHPARTPITAAEMAVKFDVPFVPAFAPVIDGRSTVHYHEPIPHGPPETMMAAFNEILSDWVRRYPEQWYWHHRRWR